MKRSGTPAKIIKRARELRQEMTPAETMLWERLRDRRLGGYKFWRQKAIGPFIVDFYCAENRLVVEIDGSVHDLQVEQDEARTKQLADFGYQVIRFRNTQVIEDLDEVLSTIRSKCESIPTASPISGETAAEDRDQSGDNQ